MAKSKKQLLGALTVFFFVATMFFSIFFISSATNMGSMTDCPFMQHEENLCPMDLLDHVQAWKSVFLFAVPQFISYLLTLYTGYAVLSRTDFFTLLRPPVHATRRYLRQAVAEYPLKPLQELYAAGILNPKLF